MDEEEEGEDMAVAATVHVSEIYLWGGRILARVAERSHLGQ